MKPSLLLLPGFDGTGELFAPLLDAFGNEYPTKVVRYAHEIAFDDYVAAALAHLADDTIVVAESFSGPVAIELARRAPDCIRGLVLCATFARSPFRPLTALAPFTPGFLLAPSPLLEPILRHFCVDESSVALLPRVSELARSLPAGTVRQRLNVLRRIDMRRACGDLRMPVLLLRATRDRIVSIRRHEELVAALPHARVEKIEGPHLLLQARPRECSRAMRTFARAL